MSFVSIEFPILLSIVFILYYMFPAIKTQNFVVVVFSYVFYAWWDWRFTPLLFGISVANYVAAILIAEARDRAHARIYLVIAVAISLVALAVFKYFNFFIESAVVAGKVLGLQLNQPSLQLILPLGISFMTFQGIAYVVDVWRGEHEAERDFVRFLAFKAFFPQLVAGPIERATHLLDQFSRPRTLDGTKVNRALWLLVYGFSLKLVVADSMAAIVDSLFVPNQPFAWSVVFGTIAFGIQIYADFCGYSLIAKGTALLLGFELIWNFRFPYWSVSISEFWRRWHISLSNWLRDYLYIPLGGSRHGQVATSRNLLVTMGLGGLWHGASWNFVFWGLLHGIALAVWRLLPPPRNPDSPVTKAAGWLATMLIVFVGWFLFRATSWPVLSGMVAALGNWEWVPVHSALAWAIAVVVVPLAVLEWLLQKKGDYFVVESPRWIAYPVYSALTVLALSMIGHHQASFIYFQF